MSTISKGKWPSVLHKLVSQESDDVWANTIERIKTHPDEIMIMGVYGQTALHAACVRYPPLHAVTAMLEACPESASVQNVDGESALHLASYGASEEVQKVLLETAPQSIALVDKYGDSSLHLAARSGATLDLLKQMVTASPETVSVTNKKGKTPFWLLSRTYLEARTIEELEEVGGEYEDDWQLAILFLSAAANMRPTPVVVEQPQPQDDVEVELQDDGLKQVAEPLGAADTEEGSTTRQASDGGGGVAMETEQEEEEEEPSSGDGSHEQEEADAPDPDFIYGRDFRIAHAAASTPACPRDLVWVICRYYPQEGLVYDDKGKTPLALAASAEIMEEPSSWDEDEDGYREDLSMAEAESVNEGESSETNVLDENVALHRFASGFQVVSSVAEGEDNDITLTEGEQQDVPSVLNMVVQWNPRAACMADLEGRLPLAHAIVSGKTWKGGIRRLLWAAPRVLETRDTLTRLYPFQLAACYSSDLDTIYCLVRSLPELLAMGIPNKPDPVEPSLDDKNDKSPKLGVKGNRRDTNADKKDSDKPASSPDYVSISMSRDTGEGTSRKTGEEGPRKRLCKKVFPPAG